MSTISFVGIALELESVTQTALATVRVKFTQDPLAVSSTGAHDGLNPANYTLTGPGSVVIKSCGIVYGDTQSIDLFTTGPIPAGQWLLSVANVQTATGATLQPPTQMAFNVTVLGGLADVNPGAGNDSDEDILRKHLNPALKGKGWNALIAGIATGEKTNRENDQLAFDQMFTSTASGLYLERRAADSGIQRPDSLGLSDELFRDYVIKVTNNKLTEESFLEVLETFYGDASVRAYNQTAQAEPYALHDGDDLTIVVDEDVTIPVVFAASDFAIVGAAKAVEVAMAITRAARNAGSQAWAAPSTDPVTGISTVIIYSASLGLSSAVRVAGGRAQNVLQFADLLPVYPGAFSNISWTIIFTAATNTVRFTTTSSVVDLTQLRAGDYVNIYGTEFAAGNRGSFTVTNVAVTYPLSQYFEVSNTNGSSQNVTQTAQSDLLYFRPTRKTIHAAADRAVIVSVPSDEADVVMPATSQAVVREQLSAAYGQANTPITISSLVRSAGVVTATATAHGMSVGDWFYLDGAVANVTPPTANFGDQLHSGYAATSVASATWTTSGVSHLFGRAVQLADGRALLMSGTDAGSTTPSTQASLITITATTSHAPNGTQYTLTNVLDAAMPSGSNFGGAVRLTDPSAGNKVLYFGGSINDGINTLGTSTALCYLYTPGAIGSNGSWASAGSMTFSRMAMAFVQRTDGKVMAIGGTNSGGIPGATVDVYNPITKTWGLVGGMNIGRVLGEAIQLDNTDVLITCGRTGTGAITKIDYASLSDVTGLTPTCETYNVSGNAWSYVGSMAYARYGHRLFRLDDGRIIAIGGIGYDPSQGTTAAYLNSTEIYDPNLKQWSAGPSMFVARAFFAAQRIGNRIYVIGGSETSRAFEYLDTTTLKWHYSTAVSPESQSVKILSSAMLGSSNQLMITVGGANGTNFTLFQDPFLLNPNSETYMAGDINGLRQVASVVNANSFTFNTNTQDYTATGSCTATPVKAATGAFVGPFAYDPQSGVAVTGSASTLSTQLSAGLQYSSVTVADATQFPDAPGYLVFDFGFAQQFQPVRYLGRLSSTQLALDYTYKFPQTIPAGASVTLLQQKGPWVPASPQSVGTFYLTDSSSGRIAASSTISSIAAGGVTVNLTVAYPGDYGLGNWGYPSLGNYKLSDEVIVWGSNDPDTDLATARTE